MASEPVEIQPHALPEPFLAVTFRIGGEVYGLPVETVCEIVSVPALLPLGGAPPYLRGLLNLRGLFLPVLDGRVLVSAPAAIELTNQVAILGGALPEFGLLVDQALAVQPVTALPSSTLPHCVELPLFDYLLNLGEQAAYSIDIAGLRALLPSKPSEMAPHYEI